MVHIKRIDIRGFKTFRKKVSLNLDKGLTVVTGPNGSGKTNIVDAVKFVLGELSSKEMRGTSLADLIHKEGLAANNPKSAYVAVQLDNRDRLIPIDADSVTVSREFRSDGEGVYRINGQRVSRKQLVDVLSSAGISISGYNIVPQHSITRLAEITAEERRRIIEDMVGIGIYDMKRAEAQVQLQQADVNLKVATARIDEVRSRVEALERERNDHLRYAQLKGAITQLQAKVVSNKIRTLEEEVSSLKTKSEMIARDISSLRQTRDELYRLKEEIELRRRSLEDGLLNREGSELFSLERQIADSNARLAALRAQLSSDEAMQLAFAGQVRDLTDEIRQLEASLESLSLELQELGLRRDTVSNGLGLKRQELEEVLNEINHLRDALAEDMAREQQARERLDEQRLELMGIEAEIERSRIRLRLQEDYKSVLEASADQCKRLIQSLEDKLGRLAGMKDKHAEIKRGIEARLAAWADRVGSVQRGLAYAQDVLRRARQEVSSHRSIRRGAKGDEEAPWMLVKRLSQDGVIHGVLGRLRDFMKVDEKYKKAVEVLASDSLSALVVKDIEAVVSCIEILRRLGAGPAKLIPLRTPDILRYPDDLDNLEGIIGPIADLIDYDETIRPIINSVFRDTILTERAGPALLLALRGQRAVTLTGDVFEPGGAVRIGPLAEKRCFEEPSLEDLRSAAESLEAHIHAVKGVEDKLREKIAGILVERAKEQSLLDSIDWEIQTCQRIIEAVTALAAKVEHEIQRTALSLEAEKVNHSSAVMKRMEMLSRIPELRSSTTHDGAGLRSKLEEAERKRDEILRLLYDLQGQELELAGKMRAIETSARAISLTLEQTRRKRDDIERQIIEMAQRVDEAKKELRDVECELDALHERRQTLLISLEEGRAKRGEWELKSSQVDAQLKHVIAELENLNSVHAGLVASVREKEMRISFYLEELHKLGYSHPIQSSPEDIQSAEATLAFLSKELEDVGNVNQLASAQYDEVKNNYKQLSTRIYQLEMERLSILRFMEELDRKKLEAFMGAFDGINREFSEVFSKISGGNARLVLENPNDPLQGGVDLVLQFPGKPEMAIEAASGGEKSVGTVCFILALQTIRPMPFYIMDEIDAHLDAVNAQRLVDLLKERSRGSQFILISLRDVTISRGDAVYGVYIQDGASQVVSLPTLGRSDGES